MDQEYEYRSNRMNFISSVDLTDMRFERVDWIVEGLLKPGLSVLAGAPKIGKSWLVLQLCLCVAKGKPFCGLRTGKGAVGYISLEDSYERLQERVLRIDEDPTDNFSVSVTCPEIGEEFMEQIASFCVQRADTRLVVIDTFQKIREQSGQMSYAGDYADVSFLKRIADELRICILLVHHTRKMGDSDYINEISGTNGIAGSADSLMLLKKQKRSSSYAKLSCTGRDIEDRELTLLMDRDTCLWQATESDMPRQEPKELTPLMRRLVGFGEKIGSFQGGNADFCERFSEYCGEDIQPNQLKRMMNSYRYELEDEGFFFLSVRRKNGRLLTVYCKKRDKADAPANEAPKPEADEPDAAQQYTNVTDTPEQYTNVTDTQEQYTNVTDAPDDTLLIKAELCDLPPTPTDDDAPPETGFRYRGDRDDERFEYKPYR